jgi:hypothetical protein
MNCASLPTSFEPFEPSSAPATWSSDKKAPRWRNNATVGFFHALAERSSRLFPGFQRVCDDGWVRRVSLRTSRATRSIHTLGPLTPHFWPKLSVVSLSRASWVNRSCSRPFGPNLPGLASEWGRNAKVLQERMCREIVLTSTACYPISRHA